MIEENFAIKICKAFNELDTIWKDTFYIDEVELEKWEHIRNKNKSLTIVLKTKLNTTYSDSETSFTCFNLDKTQELKLEKEIAANRLLKDLTKDEDFSIHTTPNSIYIMYHNFEKKEVE